MPTGPHALLSPRDIVGSGLCIGCGSCVAQSEASGARMAMDGYGQLRPVGPPAWIRRGTATFARTCPFSPSAISEDDLAASLYSSASRHHPSAGRYLAAYVGHAAEGELRASGSSGGMVSWVLLELCRSGLVDGVAHVVAAEDPSSEGRFFCYRLSRSEAEIRAGAKSRYYPVDLSDVLTMIRSAPGRYAVVGVPCFIKAIHLLRLEDPILHDRVAFTVGLFCGHMKSARFVESLAWQMGVSAGEVRRVEFRLKDERRPASTYTAQLTLRDGRTLRRDWWDLADGDWGAGFFQVSACNFCDDVTAETADISFGDAWVEPYSSDGRGTNVVIVRSPKLDDLVAAGIADGRLTLQPVDGEFVERTQAAGLRQRREGLAYRLSWPRRGVRPRKRLGPDARTPSPRRKLIYRMRAFISAWSHRVFWLARLTGRPALYVRWARASVAVYHALAYSRGRLGTVVERLCPR